MKQCPARGLAAIVAAVSITSCADSREPLLLPAFAGSPEVLAAMTHRARGERWDLRASSVVVRGPSGVARAIELPGATVSGSRDSCPPDLLLDRSGAAYVSSNAMPVIWRIDPASHAVERLEIRLEEDADRDIGFSRLAWGTSGRTMYAASSPPGALWRIDLDHLSASKVRGTDRGRDGCDGAGSVAR
jgi:sugar lactone lactonase YvrE